MKEGEKPVEPLRFISCDTNSAGDETVVMAGFRMPNGTIDVRIIRRYRNGALVSEYSRKKNADRRR